MGQSRDSTRPSERINNEPPAKAAQTSSSTTFLCFLLLLPFLNPFLPLVRDFPPLGFDCPPPPSPLTRRGGLSKKINNGKLTLTPESQTRVCCWVSLTPP